VLANRLVLDEYSFSNPNDGSVPPFDPDDAAPASAETEIDWTDEDTVDDGESTGGSDSVWLHPVRTEVRIWRDSRGYAIFDVLPPSLRSLLDRDLRGEAVSLWIRRQRVAAVLAQRLGEGDGLPLTARSLADVHRHMPRLEQKEIAQALGDADGSVLSREDSNTVIALPAGRVALDFFVAKGSRGRTAAHWGADEIAFRLLERDDLLERKNAELARALPGAGDSLDKMVNWCKAVRMWPEPVRAVAARWQADPREAEPLLHSLGKTLQDRHRSASPAEQKRVGSIADASRSIQVLWRAVVLAAGETQ
jgi:hypothetical protein